MTVTVEFQPGLRHLVGRDTLPVTFDGPASVAALLRTLIDEHPRISAALVERDGELNLAFLVAQDDVVIPRSDYATRQLRDGDRVAMYIALVGG